jgi:CheY-like chemotaxis protein
MDLDESYPYFAMRSGVANSAISNVAAAHFGLLYSACDAADRISTMTSMREPTAVPLHRTVLIVDDNEPTANALAKILSAAKFGTAVSYRGGDAVEYVEHHQIAAAVVDIHLPDLSGLVVTQKLRERAGKDIPIIILSGDTSMETLNSLPHVGATYFFSKPVNSAQLIQRLHECLVRGRADRET